MRDGHLKILPVKAEKLHCNDKNEQNDKYR